MKYKLVATMVLPLSIMTVDAFSQPPQPQRCPRASEIISVGVSHTMTEESDNMWFTGRRNQFYGTSSAWTLLFAKIDATSVDEAYTKATTALNTLSFQFGPAEGPFGTWICYYRTTPGYNVMTINPPMAQNAQKPFLNLKQP